MGVLDRRSCSQCESVNHALPEAVRLMEFNNENLRSDYMPIEFRISNRVSGRGWSSSTRVQRLMTERF